MNRDKLKQLYRHAADAAQQLFTAKLQALAAADVAEYDRIQPLYEQAIAAKQQHLARLRA